jgi:triacylglycerol lipase
MGNRRLTTRRSVLKGIAAASATVSGYSIVGTASVSDNPPGDEPLLLVHGFLDTGETPWWDVLTGYLQDIGYSTDEIYVISLGDIPLTTVDSPTDYADAVEEHLRRISDFHESEVDIIAHSMGGLDSRWAIEKQGADQYVDDLITLGTPHQGTYAAYLAYITPGGRNMIPGSDFLTELNDGQLADGVSYTALWSSCDGLILPDEYAKLPPSMLDSTSVARNICAGCHLHVDLVYHREVFEQYYEYLY